MYALRCLVTDEGTFNIPEPFVPYRVYDWAGAGYSEITFQSFNTPAVSVPAPFDASKMLPTAYDGSAQIVNFDLSHFEHQQGSYTNFPTVDGYMVLYYFVKIS